MTVQFWGRGISQCLILFSASLSLFLISMFANAPDVMANGFTYYYEALIDIDNNPATGGSVTVTQGSEQPSTISGVEYRVQAWTNVDIGVSSLRKNDLNTKVYIPPPSQPQVLQQEIYKWNGTSFSNINIDNNPYPVGVGNGNSGSNAVEFEASMTDLGNPTGFIKVVYHTDNTVGYSDYTNGFIFNAGGQTVSVPGLSGRGALLLSLLLGGTSVFLYRRRFRGFYNLLAILIVITALSTVAWAATITLDGQTVDWAGINPSITDTAGDSSNNDPNEDILYGYMTSDGSNFYFRIDFANITR